MQTSTDSARLLLDKLEQDAHSTLLSPKTVTRRLMELAAVSFAHRLCLRIKYEGEEYSWGDVSAIAQLQIIAAGSVSADAEYELLGEGLPLTRTDHELVLVFEKLAKALWGKDIRKHGAITFDRDVVRRQIGVSLSALAPEGKGTLGVVFIDIDHFKQLNSHITESGADGVIRQLNRQFHDMTREFGGLAFNRSGDEFFVFLPYDGLLPVLQALQKLRGEFKAKGHVGEDGTVVHVDLTMGVAPTNEYSSYAAAVAATDAAEALTKINGKKLRGCVKIAGSGESRSAPCTHLQLLKLGSALIRRRLRDYAFSNANLNFISQQCFGAFCAGVNLDVIVDEALAWLDLSLDSSSWESTLLSPSSDASVPRLAVALAVAHGVGKNACANQSRADTAPTINIAFSEDASRATVTLDGKRVWGNTIDGDSQFVVLSCVPEPTPERRLVGVQVGFSEDPRTQSGLPLPVDLFDRIVLVDERPITGGSLPDFWQPAIAEVFSALGKQDFQPQVLVWGPCAENSETYKKLAGTGPWKTDEVARVSKLPSTIVQTQREKVTRAVKVITNGESLVDHIFEAIPTWPRLDEHSDNSQTANRYHEALSRPMLSPNPSPLEDGLRCRNAAQAYPIIIDVLRKGGGVRITADDAKGNLKELLAFKLVLEEPLDNSIPAYLIDLQDELNAYAQRALLDKEAGLFRTRLESTRQVDAFLHHLATYLNAPTPARSTRRACLIVPNLIGDDNEPRPLGLISVWASPRVGDDRHVIDFVFVWRTVEAFVGLPYSLYGSIRLMVDLAERLSTMVPTVPNRRAPAVGELTYIPMSLHMRLDEFHERIAKRIVDESSD